MRSLLLLFSCLLVAANGLNAQLDQNLLLRYEFEGDVLDISGNDNHGIANGGITYVEDRGGNPNGAVQLDGFDDFIELPNLAELKPDLPVSFSFWVKYGSTDPLAQTVFNTSLEDDLSAGVFFNSSSATGTYAVSFGDGSPLYSPATRRTYVSNSAIVPDEWHHVVAIVRGATDMEIYVDCVENSGAYSGTGGPLFYAAASGVIGRHDRDLGVPFEHFLGAIDDFRYWDRALELSEVDILCNLLSVPEETITTEPVRLIVYPNPASSVLHIVSNMEIPERINIIDTSGRIISSSPFSDRIAIDNLPDGIYFLSVSGSEGTQSQKFIVRR